jgi:hypothetical protein
MTRATVLLLMSWVGCADTDPCAGHDGTCLGLRVTGSAEVDQLRVMLEGAAQLDALTPSIAGAAHALPVTTALFLPTASGALTVLVTGLLRGDDVGEGVAQVTLAHGEHRTVTVILLAGGGPDLAVPGDLAAPTDLSSSLPFDQSIFDEGADEGDAGAGDSAMPLDLRGDLSGTGPRRVFVLPARSAALGTLTSLDSDCTSAAAIAGLGGNYRAMVAYPTDDPHSRITLGQGRDIVVPGGQKVATDATFFTTDHLRGIDQLADGTPVTGCVWTFFDPNGARIGATSDCQGWTSNGPGDFGGVGNVAASDISWCIDDVISCDNACHIYCMEQ